MIPVLGVAVLNRHDLLLRMLRSIDVPVGRVIVIDNSEAVHLWEHQPANVERIQMRHNLGVSAAWNLVIKLSPLAPWWCITGSDVELEAGALDTIAEAMAAPKPRLVLMSGFNAFALNASAMSRVGFFDENFVPAYFEDNDMAYRCRLAEVEIVALPARLGHEGSATIMSDPALRKENQRTFEENKDYYRRKWGGGPGSETFLTPFNQSNPISHWTLDLERLRRLTWRP